MLLSEAEGALFPYCTVWKLSPLPLPLPVQCAPLMELECGRALSMPCFVLYPLKEKAWWLQRFCSSSFSPGAAASLLYLVAGVFISISDYFSHSWLWFFFSFTGLKEKSSTSNVSWVPLTWWGECVRACTVYVICVVLLIWKNSTRFTSLSSCRASLGLWKPLQRSARTDTKLFFQTFG